MRVLKKSRRYITILLLIIPTILAFNKYIPLVQAGPDIPEPHPNNAWHWGIDEGDQLYFEGEFIVTNLSSGEVTKMFKDLWIYNITSIVNETVDWFGMNEVSVVFYEQCYHNVTSGELESYGNSQELVLFGYNSTDQIHHRIRAGMSGIPVVLPLNSSSVDVDILAPILNETFYYPMGQIAYNKYDYYMTDNNTNRIVFSNTTHGYFSDGSYFDNGTLSDCSVYLAANMGDGPMAINVTMKQVFDYNITDEIIWGVTIGESFYYDWYEGSDPVDESSDLKVEVTNISNILITKNNNAFSDDPVYMTYQAVYADISFWNGTDYELGEPNVSIGIANNFYHQYLDNETQNEYNFLIPISVTIEDMQFMFNNDTLRIWGIPFDEVHYHDNDYLEVDLKNTTGTENANNKINKSTGIIASFLMKGSGGIAHYKLKEESLVDWSVNPGDILYAKDNGEKPSDLKLTILGSGGAFVNMSAIFQQFNSMGLSVTLPPSQPELQFHSYITAEIERWNPSTQSWDYYSEGPIALANTFWPLSPAMFAGIVQGSPILLPEDTTSNELSSFMDVYGTIYDDITYNTGHIQMRNSTLDRSLHFHFDEISGRITMIYGWSNQPILGSEWSYISFYYKHYQSLSSGVNTFTLNDEFSTGVIVDMEIQVGGTGTGAALIYNYFPMNPVNVSLPSGTPIVYFDQLLANYSLITGNMTMIITLPLSIDLDDIELIFIAFNMSGTDQWDEAPPEFYDYVIYDYGSNSITIEITVWESCVISAIAYITESTPPAAPTGLAATTGGTTSLSLDWDDNIEPDFDLYRIYRSTTSGFTPGPSTLVDTTTTSSYLDTGLTPDTTYYYVVIAFDVNNNPSVASSEASATTDKEETPSDIPGYDLFMISIMIIIISGLFIRKMRKK